MERRRSLALGTLLLGLVAIAATAGIYAEGSGGGFGGGPTGEAGSDAGVTSVGLPGWLVENFFAILLIGSALAFAVGILVIAWRRGREGLAEVTRFLARNLLIGVAVLLFFAGVRLLLEYVGTRPSTVPGGGQQQPGGGTPGTGAGGAEGAGGTIPPIVILLVVLAVFGLFTYVAFQRRASGTVAAGGGGGESRAEPTPTESNGPAIDLEDVPQSNAVYRAWREMAMRAVDASDRTVTASEVARAAIRAGFDREAVRRLTTLFEEVRYGDRPVTDERERHARAALRALEDTVEGQS